MQSNQQQVTHTETNLDKCLSWGIRDIVSLFYRTPACHSGWRSESGSRRQGFVTSALGRLRRKRPAGITTGPRVYPLDWDRRERVTPAL